MPTDHPHQDEGARIEAEGHRVIRFWNDEVLGNIDGVLMTTERIFADSPTPGPSREREGSE
ncbi:MAG: DUF559 domain-containing protein [Allosphingosinicella sp.]|uniref:DUF559 domain-containing protein n=1 Tax=Allosphingosinicella sp. TaxID=2823234 RepID=UPI00395944B1